MAMGRSMGDGKTGVVEEGTMGDELVGDPMSVRGQRV